MTTRAALFVVLGAAVAGCEQPARVASPVEPGGNGPADGAPVPLTGDDYTIARMATAHGAFTVEVNVAAGIDTDALARRLVEPVQDRYAEVLVYFYDRASAEKLPISRVQWTAEHGYTTRSYGTDAGSPPGAEASGTAAGQAPDSPPADG